MKEKKVKKVALIVIMFSVFVGIFTAMSIPKAAAPTIEKQYTCDYKWRIKTEIHTVNKDGEDVVISGNNPFWKKYQDPLKMMNSDRNAICFADDDFNLVSQNDHAIFKGDELLCVMEGKFNMFGNEYVIYNASKDIIAYAKFNALATKGTLNLVDGTLAASFESKLLGRDYVITIAEDNTMDEDVIQMMFASFVSDAVSDASN